MRSLRFIFIALITSLIVINADFLVRTVSYGKADAAAPPSSAVVTSKDFSVVQKEPISPGNPVVLLAQQIDLTGTWIGEGYSCEKGGLVEQVQISINGNYLVAKKITGDNCVPAGNITFQGTLPDSLAEGSSFPVTWTVGVPTNPASSKTVQSLTILNANSFISYGLKFTRVTRKADDEIPKPETYNIFIGGACDHESVVILGQKLCQASHWVENYPKPPNSQYYTWDDEYKTIADVKEKKRKNPEIKINIVGHSYGGDTAINVAGKCGEKINLLITIDPVGGKRTLDVPNSSIRNRPITNWEETVLAKIKVARPNITTWIDVDPQPDEVNKDNSDKVADQGGKWDTIPQKYADEFIPLKGYHHYQFVEMMSKVNPILQKNQSDRLSP